MTPSSYRTDGARMGSTIRVRTILAATALAAAISACADRPPDSAADVQEIAVDELARIDPEAIPGQAPFGRIADLEISEDGSVFVLDALSRTVRVFDAQGTELRTFGQRGQGPGELEEPIALFWGPDGNLWVADLGNRRFTVFEPDGGLVTTYRALGPPLASPPAVGFSEAGLLYAVALDLDVSLENMLQNMKIVLVEYEVGNGEAGPLRQIDLPFVELPQLFEYRGDGMVSIFPVPFSGHPTFRIDRIGRLWYAQTGEPSIHRWSIQDGIDLTFGRELDPLPVTPAEVQEVLDDSPEFEELRSMGPSAVAELASLIPDFKPYLEGFFFDDEQSVWVIRTAQGDSGDDMHDMDIYDSSGTLMAVAQAALESEPRPRVRDGLLAGVVRDELGVESVALYRIQR